MAPTPEQEQIIIDENIGILATLRRDGSPQLSPINYAYVDGRIYMSTTRDRAKYHNIRRNPQVSLCIVKAGNRPYVTVFGKAEVQEKDIVEGTSAIFSRMSDRPLPDKFAELLDEQRRVLIVITPERFAP